MAVQWLICGHANYESDFASIWNVNSNIISGKKHNMKSSSYKFLLKLLDSVFLVLVSPIGSGTYSRDHVKVSTLSLSSCSLNYWIFFLFLFFMKVVNFGAHHCCKIDIKFIFCEVHFFIFHLKIFWLHV